MSTARTIIVTGAVAGAGYAVARYIRNGRKPTGGEGNAFPAADQYDGPTVPLPEPDHAHARTLINHSDETAGDVVQSPDELLAQARKHIPDMTLDELTGARLAASEHGSGNATELACIIDSEQNRAARRGQSLYASLTRGHGFGKQGKKRPASTRRDPAIRHFLISRTVTSGDARGISREAIRFYDPYILNRQNGKYRRWLARGRVGDKPAIVSCDALTLLEAWSFDYGKKGGNRCPPDRSRPGRHPLAWVGPIPGVDPIRLFLMKPMPIGPEHQRIYEAARDVLRRGL